MHIRTIFIMTLSIAMVGCSVKNLESSQQSNKVEMLLATMTLEEKVGQMTQIDFSVIAGQGDKLIDQAKLIDAILTRHVGSILNTPNNKAIAAITLLVVSVSI